MSRSYSIIGKRNRLAATALAGAITIFLPAVVAHAETSAPAHSGIQVAQASVNGASEAQAAVDETIRPFQFRATDEALADLKRRIVATKWPDTHGWPGSIIEQLEIINPLTNPTAHGGSAADAFDVVIPSLPGYGFSGKPRELGWDPIRVARAWAVLMDRLGYKKYVAQGGDWGDAVNEQMALQKPAGLLGIHTNMPGTLPDNSGAGRRSAADRPDGRRGVCVEAARSIVSATRWKWEPGHRYSMGWRIRQSAWPRGCSTTIRRARRSSDGSSTGNREGLTRDDILDNITLYWLTDTAVSSARLFWESKLTFFAPKGVTIPVAVGAFPDEIYTAPRSWAEKAFPMLIHYNRLPKGGHFAAWEQPDIFAQELRASFKPLR